MLLHVVHNDAIVSRRATSVVPVRCGGSGIVSAPLPVPTVVDASSVGSVCASSLEERESCGSNTQTTFSTQHPRTVMFARVVPQPTSSDPSVSTVVSVGIVGGVSQSSGGGTQQFQTSIPGGPGVTINYAATSLFSATCRSWVGIGLPGSGNPAPVDSQSAWSLGPYTPLSQGVGGVQYGGATFLTRTRGVYSGITGGDQQQIRPATAQYVSSPVAMTQSLYPVVSTPSSMTAEGMTRAPVIPSVVRPSADVRRRPETSVTRDVSDQRRQ